MPVTTAIKELNLKLTEARIAYYAGNPIMTDAEYDTAEAQLTGLVKQHPEEAALATALFTVGTDNGGRIPHKHPMRSIQNVYSEEELMAWYRTLEPGEFVTLDSKWDGVSCSLTYIGGNLIKAVTRGDGDAGESILDQVMAITSIPKTIPVPVEIEIRGELVIFTSVMERLNAEIVAAGGKPYVSTRNLVAGTIKLRDAAEIAKREVSFRPWEVLCDLLDSAGVDDVNANSARQRLRDLVDYGFPTPDGALALNGVALKRELANKIQLLEENNPEIGRDGIVIKVDSCQRRRELGVGSKFSKFQVAYKAQNARTESILREVIWQVGRLGKLTPVGVIDPVVLAGATIERVTLNNMTWIKEMGLKIGSSVEIVRSGDVIPVITGVLD